MPKFIVIMLSWALRACLLVAPAANAQTSKDFAALARASWSSFECASLASKSGETKEQERLFMLGYRQGQQFIAALKAEKIKREDLNREAPLVMLMLLEGPSADFMLGRVFAATQDAVMKDIYRVGEVARSQQEQMQAAKAKFGKLNCALIGKPPL